MKTQLAIADEIRAELARRRRSQAELSEAIHMTPPQVSRRLSGLTPITLDEFAAICAFLGIRPSQMLDKIDAVVGAEAQA